MQIYCIKMFNFLRFGESSNSIVFDLSAEEKRDLENNKITMDEIYKRVMKNPLDHIKEVKKRGVENVISITGVIGGNDKRSNGVGKSSLLEAICFAHYEKIVRKTANTEKVEKAGLSVVTRIDGKFPDNLKESYVEELFEENGRVYRLKRGREFTKSQKSSSPVIEFECINKEEIDSHSGHRTGDTKEAISDVITMDYDVFVNSQLFGQNDSGKFLTGTDKIRKEMLISLLKLEDVVAGCLDSVRSRKNAQDKRIEGIKSNISLYENRFKNSYSHYIDLTQEFINDIISAYDKSTKIDENEIKINNLSLEEINSNINSLRSSDKLTILNNIKEEGLSIRKEKEAKEKEMNERVKDWSNLKEDSLKKIASKNNISSFESKILEKESEKKLYKDRISEHTEEINKYGDISEKSANDKKKKEELVAKLNKYSPIRDSLTGEISSENTVINIANSNIKKLSSKISVDEDAKGFTCPECNSLVTIEHIRSKIKEYEDSRASSKEKLRDLIEKKNKLDNGLLKVNNEINSIPDWENIELKIYSLKNSLKSSKNMIDNIESSILEYNTMIKNEKEDIKSINESIEKYDSKITEIKKTFEDSLNILTTKLLELKVKYTNADAAAKNIMSEINELLIKQKDISNKSKDLSEKIGINKRKKEEFEKSVLEFNNLRSQLDKETKVINRYYILEDIYGLDGIQTRIVKKYLPLLNIYIKEFLDILSNGEISVKLVINDKLKVDMNISGGTSDNFEMLSGGEKMIIRLATDIGLSLLSFSKTAQKPEIIALDEIFSNLDSARSDNVFRMLEHLKDKFNRVLIITHDANIKEMLPTNIIIEKGVGKNALSKIMRIT